MQQVLKYYTTTADNAIKKAIWRIVWLKFELSTLFEFELKRYSSPSN